MRFVKELSDLEIFTINMQNDFNNDVYGFFTDVLGYFVGTADEYKDLVSVDNMVKADDLYYVAFSQQAYECTLWTMDEGIDLYQKIETIEKLNDLSMFRNSDDCAVLVADGKHLPLDVVPYRWRRQDGVAIYVLVDDSIRVHRPAVYVSDFNVQGYVEDLYVKFQSPTDFITFSHFRDFDSKDIVLTNEAEKHIFEKLPATYVMRCIDKKLVIGLE